MRLYVLLVLMVAACSATDTITSMESGDGGSNELIEDALPDGSLDRVESGTDTADLATADGTADLADDAESDTADICVPDCGIKNCGPNGCGGICGECFPPDCNVGWCSPSGMCTYEPDIDDLPCDDTDACTPPGTCQQGECVIELPDEICGDEVDNNCDGQVDEDC